MRQYIVAPTPYTLTGNATTSVWLLNPVTVSFKIIEIGISLDNVVTNAEPVQFVLYRTITVGTPAGTSFTPKSLDETFETAQTTALVQLTTEPSTTQVLGGQWYIQPNSGLIVIQYPLGREPTSKGGGQRTGLTATTVTGVSPKVSAYVIFEE